MYGMKLDRPGTARPRSGNAAFRTRRLEFALLIGCFLISGALAAGAQHKRTPNGSALFAENCAACHGSDGRGGERAPNIATRPNIAGLSDARLNSIVANGIPAGGMPAFSFLGSQQVDALVAYLRVLQGLTSTGNATLPGDPQSGKAIFFRASSCSGCHMVNGEGGYMGPDLSSFARGRTVAVVELAIEHPPERLAYSNRLATATTRSGQSFTGLIRSQDNFVVVLQSQDGAYHSLSRDNLRALTLSEQPYMPENYGITLSRRQLNDLVSFLLKSAQSQDPPRVIPKSGRAR
jgi:putative heme-binding domain-containing protein